MNGTSKHKQSVALFGASGSIGSSTLAVLKRHPDRFLLHAVTAKNNVETMFSICVDFQPNYAILVDEQAADVLRERLEAVESATQVLSGKTELEKMAASDKVDVVVCAIVGAAGLTSCFAAARTGKKILLANKESVVIAGSFLLAAAKESGAEIIPLDSEHNAIFQCHPLAHNAAVLGHNPKGVNKIFLTASGGPFLDRDLSSFDRITPDEACAHPRWDMGPKISVDSASMMNKGLELIEASVLFGLGPEKIEVVIHPQSVVHSMVEYVDGSILAQLGTADMQIPIAHALGFPERIESGAKGLSLKDMSQLDFSEPCNKRFPALFLAKQAAEEGKVLPVVLNAANEVAVDHFLQGKTSFLEISSSVEQQMQSFSQEMVNSLDDVIELDQEVRVATINSI